MKEISKLSIILLLGCLMFTTFSCKTASIINFESEAFEKFKSSSIRIEEYPDTFYYTRITTAVWVQLIFRKFSKENDFSELILQNISIVDDEGLELYKVDNVLIFSNDVLHSENSCNYQIYSYQIDNSVLSPEVFQKNQTEYIIINFEIDGIKYSEKLTRDEKKYLVTRT